MPLYATYESAMCSSGSIHFFIYIEQNVGKRLSYPSFFLNKRERDATEYKSHSLIISAFVNQTIKFITIK